MRFLQGVVKHPFATAIGSVIGAIAVLELIGPSVNGSTAAQILLLVILLDARFFGTRPALTASVFGVAGLSRYFMTPRGFTFGDPNDVAALAAFIIMAVIGGELASRAEKRAREVEKLYRQLQAAFERESEAEAARRNERLKATLLDAMAHNLRTPLTAIKAAVTAMLVSRDTNDGALTLDQQWELLAVIDEESDRLNRFIGGLVGRAASSESEPATLRGSRIREIVDTAVARAETLTRDHTVIVAVDGEVPAVAVDRAAVIEVLYILLDNASKYAPPGTSIRLSAMQNDANRLSVRVTDEGPGIPLHFRERVFERFFRIPNRESHDLGRAGVGVGLALAKQLIETQSGQITVEDGPSGRGTTVVITLPIAGDAIPP